jgi:prolyl-tRNA synthetase
VPWIVVVGRGWADGVVELRNRFSGETRTVSIDDAATAVVAALAEPQP